METIAELGERRPKSYTVYNSKLLHEEKSTSDKVLKYFKGKLPILKWLPRYRKEYILSDLIAGITVWITNIPASMGDATVAGVSPEYGLYSSYMGVFIYLFLGSCKQLVIGAQAVLSLLSYQTCGNNYPECVNLLSFYSGAIHLCLGILHLGFLVSFISEPVAVGFTAGAAVLIASGQIKSFLGIKGSSAGSNLIPIWKHISEDFHTLRVGDSVLGVLSVIVLVTFFKLKDMERLSRWKKPLHILSMSRNAIIMIITTLLGYFFYDADPEKATFLVTGKIREGFQELKFPSFELVHPDKRYLNGTGGTVIDPDAKVMSTLDTLSFFGSTPLVIAFIAILQNVAIGRKFQTPGSQVEATQELLALGVINLVNAGFFSAIPTSASFSRSAVNASSGVKSHFSALLAGLLMLVSLAFLTPYLMYIPKASLASIIIAAMIFMIDFQTIWRLWKFSKMDLLGAVITFLASVLLGMQYGIITGVAKSILVILLKSLRPALRTEYRHHLASNLDYVFVHTDQGLNFPSVDYIQSQVMKLSRTSSSTVRPKPNTVPEEPVISFDIIVLDCSMWTKWDYTSVNTLINLVDSLAKSGKICIFYQLTKSWIDLFAKYGLLNPFITKDLAQLEGVLVALKNETVVAVAGDLNPNLTVENNGDGGGDNIIVNTNGGLGGFQKRLRRRNTTLALPISFGPEHGHSSHYATISTPGQFRGGSFNVIRRKYSIQVED